MELQPAIYVRCSKCAGASLKSALRAHSRSNYTYNQHYVARYRLRVGSRERLLYTVLHGQVRYVESYLAGTFDRAWKFAVVRNPWDRAISAYHYCQRYGEIPAGVSFKEYLRLDFASMNRFVFVHSQPQFDVLSNAAGCQYLDFVGRFETLQRDFNRICRRLGIPSTTLPHRHRTRHAPYWEYYDRQAVQLVKQKYKRDIDWLGYEFAQDVAENLADPRAAG